MPPEWRPAAPIPHEIWLPSDFTGQAIESLAPARVRVVPPALGLIPPRPSARDRASFDLPEDAVIVLVSFNLASSRARKNPLGAIAAFRDAFGIRADRLLVVKLTYADHAPEDFAVIEQAARAPNIRLMTETLSGPDRHALTAAANIVLSTHRAEGFGLVPAEAMLLGKPVVATGWSGNLTFMTRANACLIDYRLVAASDPAASTVAGSGRSRISPTPPWRCVSRCASLGSVPIRSTRLDSTPRRSGPRTDRCCSPADRNRPTRRRQRRRCRIRCRSHRPCWCAR